MDIVKPWVEGDDDWEVFGKGGSNFLISHQGVTGLDSTLFVGKFSIGTASGNSLLRLETVLNNKILMRSFNLFKVCVLDNTETPQFVLYNSKNTLLYTYSFQ